MRRLSLLVIVCCLSVSPVLAQTATPTPTPTIIPIPADDLYQALATSEAIKQQAPADLSAPGGQPLLPATDGSQIFGYAKWLVSSSAAAEIGGPFATLIVHTGIVIGMQMALIAIYVIVLGVVYLVKWAIFIYRLAMELIRTIANVIDALH